MTFEKEYYDELMAHTPHPKMYVILLSVRQLIA